jgi:hypothetical protein
MPLLEADLGGSGDMNVPMGVPWAAGRYIDGRRLATIMAAPAPLAPLTPSALAVSSKICSSIRNRRHPALRTDAQAWH